MVVVLQMKLRSSSLKSIALISILQVLQLVLKWRLNTAINMTNVLDTEIDCNYITVKKILLIK